MPHSRAAGGDLIWRPTRLSLYARDGWTCYACGWTPDQIEALRSITEGADCTLPGRSATMGLSLDHIDPRKGNDPRNLATLCTWCNSSKQNRTLRAWRPNLVRSVRALVRRPVSLPLGKALCDALYPGWIARQRDRMVDLRGRRKSGSLAAESPFAFFEQLARVAA